MNLDKLPHWVQPIVAALTALGGLGMFIVALIDSSILPLPVINDLLVMNYAILHPARMPYYATMASLGSIAGCIILYFPARKGGEAFFRKRAGKRAAFVQAWLEKNGFGTVLIGALLPPPTPFKIVVLGAGVFRVPFRSFILALLISRLVRYFGEGLLAIWYGKQMLDFIQDHPAKSGIILFVGVAVIYFGTRLLLGYFRRKAEA